MTGDSTAPKPDAEEPQLNPVEQSEHELDRAINELRMANEPEEPQTAAEAKPDSTPMRRAADNRLVMSIPVNVDVVLGTAEIPVSELMSLKRGATVVLDRRIGDPVDVVVSGRRIARGEITVMEEDSTRFGIRLTEVVEN